VRPVLPVDDLLAWLIERHPGRDIPQLLAGFSQLVFDPAFNASFTERDPRAYTTPDGVLEAAPVQLTSATQ
jgi:hypothetical protein